MFYNSEINDLFEENPNIELIEIWDRVLYLRMKKGRNKFHTKKFITEEKSGVYINWGRNKKKTYYQLMKKYHPDIDNKYIELAQEINIQYEQKDKVQSLTERLNASINFFEWCEDNPQATNEAKKLIYFYLHDRTFIKKEESKKDFYCLGDRVLSFDFIEWCYEHNHLEFIKLRLNMSIELIHEMFS